MKSDPTKVKMNVDPRNRYLQGTTVHGNMDFYVPFISPIADNLWQGGCQAGLVLPTNINFLVSLYPWERYTINHQLRGELYIRMYDDRTQPVIKEQVKRVAELVNYWRHQGNVLVHCQAGLNRSALVAIYALMLEGANAKESIKSLRESRSPAVLCNPAFEEWLVKEGETK